MNGSRARKVLLFLVRTNLGRMILLGGGVTLTLAVLSGGCASRKKTPLTTSSSPAGDRPGPPAGELPPRPDGFAETLPLAQQYRVLVSSYGERVAAAEKDLQATRQMVETLKNALEEARAANTKREGAAPAGPQEGERSEKTDGPPPAFPGLREASPVAAGGGKGSPEGVPPASGADLRVLELSTAPASGPGRPRRTVHIPAGTGGLATVLNGVFAPISGEPSPVRLRLEAALLGPNRSRIPIRDSFLVGKASGDPNSCRVTIEVHKISTVKGSGRPVEAKMLGYVVGEDGREGVPGSYEWRAAEILPFAALAGGLQGGAEALALRETATMLNPLGGATSIVTGDALRLAGLRAASGASGRTGELILERLREIRPAVSIPAGSKVEVVFLEGVTLEGLDAGEMDPREDHDPFHGLDLHR